MTKFCTKCGKEIRQGVAFCAECGTKAPSDSGPTVIEAANTTPEVKPETPVVPSQQRQSYNQQETYSQPVFQPPQQAAPAAPAPNLANKIVGTGTYFGLMFLFAIPIIGQIACIIMAFTPKNKNLKNYARAMLIWTVIALVIGGILIALFLMFANTFTDFIRESTGGEFSGWGDIFGNLGDLEGLIEQFENGGFENLPIK